MTKTEELREKIYGTILGWIDSCDSSQQLADEILKLLVAMGCGIWTEKELPPEPKAGGMREQFGDILSGYRSAQMDMLKHISECFEPIKTK